MADNFVKVNSKQRWKDAVSKFKRAVVPEQNDLGKLSEDLIDSVRVRVVGTIESDKTIPYLEEIARAKQTINGYEYPILRMGADELKNHQLFYDKTFRVLIDNNNKTATTVGKESKHTKDIQAFILAKDGSLYIGNHKGQYDPMHPTLTHASFLGGRPVEMAGMISINANGKIDMLSSDSGHYAPEVLDTYRGIKRLQELMPDIFTPNAQIKYYDTTFHNMKISEFTEMMEESDTNDKPLHQTLRDQRVQEFQQYRENLKNAISIKIDSDNDLPNSIANFTKEKQQELTTGLKAPMMSISIRNSEGKVSTYNISDTVISVLNFGNPESMQKLLDSGINTRKEFHAIKPLYYATSQGKSEIVKTMLNDPIMQESLKQELLSPAPTTLHMAAAVGNTEIINTILKYPSGQQLLTKRDNNGHTPLEVANNLGETQVANILSKEYLILAKDQLTRYLKDEMEGKDIITTTHNIITTTHKTEMKNKIVEILYPFAHEKNKSDVIEVAGSMVRESAKIAGKKLDWQQRIAAISDMIKGYLPKIFSNEKKQKLKNILKDTNITNELQKLRKDYKVKPAVDITTVPTSNKAITKSKGVDRQL